MKTKLILPDIHHRVDQVDKIIKSVGADQVICLGDVFDDFDDTPDMVRNTSEWLVEFVKNPNHIMITGNHDMHYRYPNRCFKCSGYEQWKEFITNDMITQSTWNELKWYHWLDDKFLLTHAGLDESNLPEDIDTTYKDREKFIYTISSYLDEQIADGFKYAAEGHPHWVFGAGRSRGGAMSVGGITWCDFEREFIPIRGLNQIVGHTPNRYIRWKNLPSNGKRVNNMVGHEYVPTNEILDNVEASTNICLDTNNYHYSIWNGKKLTTHHIGDL